MTGRQKGKSSALDKHSCSHEIFCAHGVLPRKEEHDLHETRAGQRDKDMNEDNGGRR